MQNLPSLEPLDHRPRRSGQESMTIDDAARILRGMYEAGGVSGRHRRTTAIRLFGIKYAGDVEPLSIPDIPRQAGLPDSYRDEINKGRALAEYVVVMKDFP